MAWTCLVCAGLLEIAWAAFMKKSSGFSLPGPTALTIGTMLASFTLLSIAMKTLPLGTAYTIWTGIGAVGAFIVGIVIFGEAATPQRWLAAALIISGIVTMKLSESS
jgi:quaternary ammonium compound-resistance protein SugE